jgi:hypothetical protein
MNPVDVFVLRAVDVLELTLAVVLAVVLYNYLRDK